MAMISCPECGNPVSSLATACPNCGYPLAAVSGGGFVKIRTPAQIGGSQRTLRRPAKISGNHVDWTGDLGSYASFYVEGPTRVYIDLANDVKPFWATVHPHSTYTLRCVSTRLSRAEYELLEIE